MAPNDPTITHVIHNATNQKTARTYRKALEDVPDDKLELAIHEGTGAWVFDGVGLFVGVVCVWVVYAYTCVYGVVIDQISSHKRLPQSHRRKQQQQSCWAPVGTGMGTGARSRCSCSSTSASPRRVLVVFSFV